MPQGLLGCPLEPRGPWGAPGAPGALDPSVALEAWRRSGPYGGALQSLNVAKPVHSMHGLG